jgi:tetratricopeptide (TPR) repeat protein
VAGESGDDKDSEVGGASDLRGFQRGSARAETEIDPPDFAMASQVGQARPVPVLEATSIRGVRSPLVGRQAELDQLLEVIDAAQDFSAPQLVTLVGNQGTGKTRLMQELAQRVKVPARVYFGRATGQNARHSALKSLLCHRFGIVEGDTEDKTRANFIREVEKAFADRRVTEVLHFLGEFVDLRFADSPFVRVLSENPAQHDEIARTVLRRFFEMDARRGPLVLVLDDLHAADTETLNLLRELGESLGGSPVVIVACARPELLLRFSDWGTGETDHLRIDLRNLDPEPARDMFRRLLSHCKDVPDDLVDEAVDKTGGNPYFLEQLVRLFLVNGTIDPSGDEWKLDREKAASTELPISVEEAIEARIAALSGDERDVLEKAAVFGSVFWAGAVVGLCRVQAQQARLSGVSGRALTEDLMLSPLAYDWTDQNEPIRSRVLAVLDDLVERDYVLRLTPRDSSVLGDVEYVFKHNLERELIAKSTDGRKVQNYHRLAAQWFESKLAQRTEEQLEYLAQLYEKGGDPRRATYCYLAGADRAYARYAHESAVNLYSRALEMMEEDDVVAHLSALHNLGAVQDTLGRTEEAIRSFTEMLHRAWLFDHPAKAGAAYSRLGRVYRRIGQFDQAMDHLVAAHALFRRAEDRRGIAGTLDDMGRIHWIRGAYGKALEFHRTALALRKDIGDPRSIALSLANIGRVLNDCGDFKAATHEFKEALKLRRRHDDLSGVVLSLCDIGGVETTEGNYDAALDMFAEALSIANEIGEKLAQAEVLMRYGECKHALGRGPDAVEHLLEAISLSSQLGNRLGMSASYTKLAEVYLGLGDAAQAKDAATRALALAKELGSMATLGHAYRVFGEVLSAEGKGGEAEAYFKKALDIFGEIQSSSGLARSYRAYAGCLERQGRFADAQELRVQAEQLLTRP